MTQVDYSPAYYEEIAAVREVSIYEWRLNTAKTHRLAMLEAERLSSLHSRIRIVIDGADEYAITCDECGLWAHYQRKLRGKRDSLDDSSGSLLSVVECDALELHRRFGNATTRDGEEAWNGYTGWDFNPILDWDHLDGYTNLTGVKGKAWMQNRKVWSNEESTEEQGSRDWIDRFVSNRRSSD